MHARRPHQAAKRHRNRRRFTLVEFAVHHLVFRPTHKIRESDVVAQIRSDLFGHGLLSYRHGAILHFPVPRI
jgi:hypothetical protein